MKKSGEHVLVRCTADLKAGVVKFAIGVDNGGRLDPVRVPMTTLPPPQKSWENLSPLHFYAAAGKDMRVTLLDE